MKYLYQEATVRPIFEKWRKILRLEESWDVRLELVEDRKSVV